MERAQLDSPKTSDILDRLSKFQNHLKWNNFQKQTRTREMLLSNLMVLQVLWTKQKIESKYDEIWSVDTEGRVIGGILECKHHVISNNQRCWSTLKA